MCSSLFQSSLNLNRSQYTLLSLQKHNNHNHNINSQLSQSNVRLNKCSQSLITVAWILRWSLLMLKLTFIRMVLWWTISFSILTMGRTKCTLQTWRTIKKCQLSFSNSSQRKKDLSQAKKSKLQLISTKLIINHQKLLRLWFILSMELQERLVLLLLLNQWCKKLK